MKRAKNGTKKKTYIEDDTLPIFTEKSDIIKIFTKYRAHRIIVMQYEMGRDKHFIDLSYISKKNKNVVYSDMIISTDVGGWTTYLENTGWKSIENIKKFMNEFFK